MLEDREEPRQGFRSFFKLGLVVGHSHSNLCDADGNLFRLFPFTSFVGNVFVESMSLHVEALIFATNVPDCDATTQSIRSNR